MTLYKVTRRFPNFVDVDEASRTTHTFENENDLVSIPWVRRLMYGKGFMRLSRSDELLMAEFDDNSAWAVGYLNPAPPWLPNWEKR